MTESYTKEDIQKFLQKYRNNYGDLTEISHVVTNI